jgi:23S rRNA (uracil1939-C5)-methyltransferase
MALVGKYSLTNRKWKVIGTALSCKECTIGDDTVRLEIEKLVSGGDGLARHQGGVVFVPRGVPGDVVVGTVRRGNRGRTILENPEIQTPGPDRRRPPCPFVPACGGCDWQHITDDGQRLWKRKILAENLQRIGKLALPEESISVVSGDALGYRTRLRVHRRGGVSGFYRENSHEIVPIDRCIVATAGTNAVLKELSAPADAGEDITVIDSGEEVYRSDRHTVAEMTIRDRPFSFSIDGFSQSNRGLLEPLGELLRRVVSSGRLVDLYAGAGLLPFLILSEDGRFTRVVCVEPDRRNTSHIAANLKWTGVDITVITDTAERALRRGAIEATGNDGGVTTVLLDPPRGGVSTQVRTWLVNRARKATGRPDVVYLSCDSAALARDLGELMPAYSLESVTLLDFFPQTSHIEALAVLRPAEPAAGAAGDGP